MNRILSLLIVLLAVSLPFAGSESAPQGPKLVSAASTPHGTVIAWLPDEDTPLQGAVYKVYGVQTGGLTLLGSVDAPSASFLAPQGYLGYGVSVEFGGVESAPTRDCPTVHTPPLVPPGIWFECLSWLDKVDDDVIKKTPLG